MANGFRGTEEQWERMQAPLRKLDARLEMFAASSGMSIYKNVNDGVSRSLGRNDGIERQLDIVIHDGSQMTFSLGIAAWKGGAKRFAKS